MTRNELFDQIKKKQSYLCVGLDTDLNKIPKYLLELADAKRGDIGNTSALYAKAFFDQMSFDSITVAPYMGQDSVTPFLRDGKWVILLVHTSNPGSADFQLIVAQDSGKRLYQEVIEKSKQWATADAMMYVVGATRADKLSEIRTLAPDHFFLVPGVGAQGGNLQEVSKHGMNKEELFMPLPMRILLM